MSKVEELDSHIRLLTRELMREMLVLRVPEEGVVKSGGWLNIHDPGSEELRPAHAQVEPLRMALSEAGRQMFLAEQCLISYCVKTLVRIDHAR